MFLVDCPILSKEQISFEIFCWTGSLKIIMFWEDVQYFAIMFFIFAFKMNGKELLKQQEICLNSTTISLIQQRSLRNPDSCSCDFT